MGRQQRPGSGRLHRLCRSALLLRQLRLQGVPLLIARFLRQILRTQVLGHLHAAAVHCAREPGMCGGRWAAAPRHPLDVTAERSAGGVRTARDPTFLKMSCSVRSALRLSRRGSAPKVVVMAPKRHTGQELCSPSFRNPTMHILHHDTTTSAFEDALSVRCSWRGDAENRSRNALFMHAF